MLFYLSLNMFDQRCILVLRTHQNGECYIEVICTKLKVTHPILANDFYGGGSIAFN